MQNQNSKKKNKSTEVSAWEAIAFSPWLFIVYFVVSRYVSNLNEIDQGTIKSFIEWFGTAYSLFLALVLVNVWAQFDTVDREFDFEIDALATLYNTVKSTELPEVTNSFEKDNFQKIKTSIIENIKNYIEHVRKNHSQEQLNPQQRRNGNIFLENIDKNISLLAFNKVIPDSITSQFYDSLNNAMDVRGDRIAHSKQHTRGVVLLVAYVASIVWLLSFFGLVITDPLVAIVLIGGATFVIIMVITIIRDLDKPFEGAWQVDLNDWDELLELINPGLQIIFVYNLEDTIVDDLKNLVGKKTCKLRTLSRTGFFGVGWKEFLNRITRASVDASENVICSVLFLEQFSPYVEHVKKPGESLMTPMIVLKQGDKFEVLLDSLEISDCSDLNKLETVLIQKIKTRFGWY